LEQQLQQAQKLEALGTMAGGITHNLNNVLAIILGRSELGAQMLEAENPARENFEIIMRTAARSSDMIKRLLTFSRKQAGGMKPVEVAPLIREQLSLMRNYLRAISLSLKPFCWTRNHHRRRGGNCNRLS
jgi:C4-dicarboxylate-specific signal transduction histidine kinase